MSTPKIIHSITEKERASYSERVQAASPDKCWNWDGFIKPSGYGVCKIGGLKFAAHRVGFFIANPDFDQAMQLDHICRNRSCQNPSHLETVTNKENTARGIGITAILSKRTCCNKGHWFTPENTQIRPNGSRRCRECNRIRMQQKRSLVIPPSPTQDGKE